MDIEEELNHAEHPEEESTPLPNAELWEEEEEILSTPEEEVDSLLIQNSPTTLRNVRRVNNIPIFLVVLPGAIFLLVMMYSIFNEPEKGAGGTAQSGGETASGTAAKLMMAEMPVQAITPVVEKTSALPPQLEMERVPEEPEAVPAVATAPKETPKQLVDPLLLRYRERRLALFEQALASELHVSMQRSSQGRAVSGREGVLAEIERVQEQIRALESGGDQAAAAQYRAQLAQLQAAQGGSVTPVSGAELNRGATEAISEQKIPRTKYVVQTGSVIPATLISGINSDLPGQIIGQVSQNVYDSPTGKYLLIPQGARLVGEYTSSIKYGQSRVFAVWQRIVFPDGKSIDLGAFPAATGAGYAGMRDKVNNHYIRIFGSAILLSGIIAGVEYSQNQNRENENSNNQRMGDTMSEALGQTLGQTMAQMIQRNMDIAPTLEIRPGFRLNVMLIKDLEFPAPYSAFDYRKGGN